MKISPVDGAANIYLRHILKGSDSATRIAMILLLCLICQTGVTAAPKKSSLNHDITEMEESVFGKAQTGSPLSLRVKNLEIELNGTADTGNLNKRVSALKKKTGKAGLSLVPAPAPSYEKGSAREAGKSTENKNRTKENDLEKTTDDLKAAIKLHTSGKTDAAEALFKKVLTVSPYNADACFSLGTISEARGDLTAALGYYSTAALANPLDSEAQTAVREIQEKIAAKQTAPFVNPLYSDNSGNNILRARAIDINNLPAGYPLNYRAQEGTTELIPGKRRTPVQAVRSNQTIPTVGIKQKNNSSGIVNPIARTVARSAFSAVLSGTGLHCPMCNLLRGF